MVGSAADPERETAAAARHARAVEVGRAFAEIVRDESFVRELWVTADTEEPGIHLWLITDPIDWDEIRALYEAPLDRMYERFPDGDFVLQILNPSHTIGDVHRSLRPEAERIPFPAG
jgi:hypothetical protein